MAQISHPVLNKVSRAPPTEMSAHIPNFTSTFDPLPSIGSGNELHHEIEEGFNSLQTDFESSTAVSLTVAGYYVSAFFLFLIAVVGFLNNLAVILVMARNKHLRTPLNGLLLNLALSDMGISIIGAPFSMVAALQHGWSFSEEFCVIYAFLMSLFGITSITTLTVLSMQRCLMIVKPLLFQDVKDSRLFLTIIGIWTFSTILTAPPLVGWGKYGIEGPGISCSVDWESRNWNSSSYIVFLFFFGLGIPLLVMGTSYVKILQALRNHAATTTITRGATTKKAERRVTIMVVIMGITFLIAWFPYALFALIVAAGYDSTLADELSVIPAIFAKSSCIYNPVIYVGLNTQFRSAWLSMIKCWAADQQELTAQERRNQQRLTTEKFSLTNNSDNPDIRQKVDPDIRHKAGSDIRHKSALPESVKVPSQLLVTVDSSGEAKTHLTVPMREFKTSTVSISEGTSVSEMV